MRFPAARARRSLAASLLLGVACGALVPSGAHADGAGVSRDVVRALRERDDRERAMLLERAVAGAASASDADAILQRLLPRARTPVDVEIGIHALARMDDADALARIGAAARDGGDRARRLLAIEALGRSDAAAASVHLEGLQFDADAHVRAAAVTALGERGELDDEIRVGAALDDADWRVRSAAIWALARTGWSPPAAGSTGFDPVPRLIGLLRTERGRLVDDCADALAVLLGERYGARAEAYGALWAKRTGRLWETPEPFPEPPAPSLQAPLVTSRSRRILFALSIGESMKQEISPPTLSGPAEDLLRLAGDDLVEAHRAARTKLDLARVHLTAMIRLLADGTDFDVAVYADSPTFAFGDLVQADGRTRKRAEARIASLSAGGGGNLSGMLLRAFDTRGREPLTAAGGPDTVVLFSDGRLAPPGLTERNQVNMAVRRWNRVRQIRFIVVGLTPADDAVLGPLGGGPPRGVDIRIP